jgi:hypothetical protein
MRLLPSALLFIFPQTHSTPLTQRSVSLASLAGLSTLPHDLSTTNTRHPEKYFHEALFHHHYDGRFASAPIASSPVRLLHMRLLLATYTHVAARAHVRTWIAHGSLLGWWWNGRLLPWDSDVDVHVDEAGMAEWGGWWNMTVHAFSAAELGLVGDNDDDDDDDDKNRRDGKSNAQPRIPRPSTFPAHEWTALLTTGKKYLLETNPRATNTSTRDRHNVIDARWIDVATGLFIDITTVHPVPGAQAPSFPTTAAAADNDDDDNDFAFTGDQGNEHARMYTKDTHLYPRAALFPLRETTLEGVRVRVPYAYEALLRDEYGPRALTETWYRKHVFEGGEWVDAPRDA